MKTQTLENVKTFSRLKKGTVINFNRATTADDTNFVVLSQYEDNYGKWTEVLNLETLEKDCFMQHTQIINFWSVVKEH